MDHASAQTTRLDAANSTGDDKSTPDPVEPIGEGIYEGTRLYAEGIGDYLAEADVAKDAAAAAPDSNAEADELKRAETVAAARSRAPGE